jgi:hypothetical protein
MIPTWIIGNPSLLLRTISERKFRREYTCDFVPNELIESMDHKAHSQSMTQVMFDDIETCDLQFQKLILDRLVDEGKDKYEVSGMYRDKIKNWHWVNGLVLADFLNGQK